MFGVSGGELIILLLIGLVVLGPERLPRVANQIGGWLGQARRMTRVMKRQLEEELDLNETFKINPPPASREPSTQPKSVEKTAPDTEKPDGDAEPESAIESEPVLPRDDDNYSPAHAAEETDTGVGKGGNINDQEPEPEASDDKIVEKVES
jgi:sec-independent protein translocase protein TatB